MSVVKAPCAEIMAVHKTYDFIDARSPSEYARGHIPGACNIALFSDQLRALFWLRKIRLFRSSN